MAVLSSTATVLPVTGGETDVATIAPGAPLDNISVYFQGGMGGSGPLGLALYAVVGGFRTRVAQAQVQGSVLGSLVEFQTIGKGDSETEDVDAAGTTYVVTVVDLSVTIVAAPPRQNVTITLAGVNQFDTVADQNFGTNFVALATGATGTLATFNGFAQLMDVAIDQTNLPPVLVSVTADCGVGTVAAVVNAVSMSGRDETISSVFRGLKLPVATRYFVAVTNLSQVLVTVTLTGVTYSVAATTGGSVVLGGDVTGPSAANTVVKWDNVPLLIGAAPGFSTPVDAAVPVYDIGLNEWRTFALSGMATMTNAGVVSLTGSAVVTLGGDVTGPSNANTVGKWENVSLLAGAAPGFATPSDAAIPIYDIGANEWRTFVLSGGATMTNAGVVTVGAGTVTLTGNANGAANANTVESFGIEAVNTSVAAGAFVPAAGEWYVGISGLTGNVTVTLADTMPSGSTVTVKDEDGSLGAFTITVQGSTGKTIDGQATFVMGSGAPGPGPGPFGSSKFIMNFHAPTEWQVV